MLYFFHHYELPLILQQAHLLRNPQSIDTGPNGLSSTPTFSENSTQNEPRSPSILRRIVWGEGLELVVQRVLFRRNETAESSNERPVSGRVNIESNLSSEVWNVASNENIRETVEQSLELSETLSDSSLRRRNFQTRDFNESEIYETEDSGIM